MRIHPVLRAISVVVTLAVVGCAGLLGNGESEGVSKPTESKKSSEGTKPVFKDNLIVAGKRLGPVSVGMPVSQLYDVMGEPTQTVKGRGTERYVFEGLQVVVDDADGSVVMVSTESPDFATADGLKVGLTDLAVKAKLAKGQGQLFIQEEGETTSYFAAGIVVVVIGRPREVDQHPTCDDRDEPLKRRTLAACQVFY